MPPIDRRVLQNFDWMLVTLVVFLLGVGFVNLYSSTYAGAGGGFSEEMRRQLLSLGLGLAVLVVVVVFDYRHFERLALPVYFATTGIMAATLVLAPVTRGNQSWLLEGRLQPAELARLAMILVLARYFSRNPPGEVRRLADLVRPLAIVAFPVGLILLQKDMGVALLTLLVGCSYLALVRIRARTWAVLAALGTAALASAWLFVLAPYQRSRILDVIDPGRDPLASGYQVNQSRIAIGSGGLWGKGWLEGTQTQLSFLPTRHTDFAFSVVGEEWGFVGSLVVLSAYLLLLAWGLVIGRNSKDAFGAMLAVGVVGSLFWPAVLNVGMDLGLAPVIGVPLPFVSYGGSALVATLLAIGLLLNVSLRRYVF
jgi:rod shape determining protein RodA